jgi:hypothetical protein
MVANAGPYAILAPATVFASASADVAQLAEQLFRKQQVKSSNLFVGSP